jgi:hypothetical protein
MEPNPQSPQASSLAWLRLLLALAALLLCAFSCSENFNNGDFDHELFQVSASAGFTNWIAPNDVGEGELHFAIPQGFTNGCAEFATKFNFLGDFTNTVWCYPTNLNEAEMGMRYGPCEVFFSNRGGTQSVNAAFALEPPVFATLTNAPASATLRIRQQGEAMWAEFAPGTNTFETNYIVLSSQTNASLTPPAPVTLFLRQNFNQTNANHGIFDTLVMASLNTTNFIPTLKIERDGTNAIFSWLELDVGTEFLLQSSTNLMLTNGWTDIPKLPFLLYPDPTGKARTVMTNEFETTTQFYRLKKGVRQPQASQSR